MVINGIIQCINILINHYYFQHNKNLFTQNDGFVMGSLLRALLSKLNISVGQQYYFMNRYRSCFFDTITQYCNLYDINY